MKLKRPKVFASNVDCVLPLFVDMSITRANIGSDRFLLDTKSTQWEDPRVQINNKPSQVGVLTKMFELLGNCICCSAW